MTKQITIAQFNDAVKGSRGFQLLTVGNPKTAKGEGRGYFTFILHLAPASLSGWNVCPMATAGCKAACLNTAGRGGIMGGHGILTLQTSLTAYATQSRTRASIARVCFSQSARRS
jgi:hypothetical protein